MKNSGNKYKKMQIGRRIAYLKKCVRTIELMEQFENETSVRKRVFYRDIAPVLNCSYTTFNNMLNERNPAKELDELQAELNKL